MSYVDKHCIYSQIVFSNDRSSAENKYVCSKQMCCDCDICYIKKRVDSISVDEMREYLNKGKNSMFLVTVYLFNNKCRKDCFYAESWEKVMKIFGRVVDIDKQKTYIQTIKKSEGTIVSATLDCDDFEFKVKRIADFSEFENREFNS